MQNVSTGLYCLLGYSLKTIAIEILCRMEVIKRKRNDKLHKLYFLKKQKKKSKVKKNWILKEYLKYNFPFTNQKHSEHIRFLLNINCNWFIFFNTGMHVDFLQKCNCHLGCLSFLKGNKTNTSYCFAYMKDTSLNGWNNAVYRDKY